MTLLELGDLAENRVGLAVLGGPRSPPAPGSAGSGFLRVTVRQQ